MPHRIVEITVDEDQRRTHVHIGGQATGPQVWQKLCELFESLPEASGYDMLFDIRDYTGDVTADDVKPIVDVYQRVRVPEAEGTRTAFVTSDPNFTFWAEAMTHQFPGRLHQPFRELAEGNLSLSTPRSER